MEQNLDNYEFGQPYYGDIPEKDIEKYAVMFGEGSKSLTDLLRYCFRNNIKTFACCKGHKETGPGYIGFLPDEEMLKYLCEMSDQINLNHTVITKFENMLRAAFYVKSEKDFKTIHNLVQKYNSFKKMGYNYKPRFKDTIKLIETIKMDEREEIQIRITKGRSYISNIEDGELIEEGYYCPNSSVTHILHSKITNEVNKSFENDEKNEIFKEELPVELKAISTK